MIWGAIGATYFWLSTEGHFLWCFWTTWSYCVPVEATLKDLGRPGAHLVPFCIWRSHSKRGWTAIQCTWPYCAAKEATLKNFGHYRTHLAVLWCNFKATGQIWTLLYVSCGNPFFSTPETSLSLVRLFLFHFLSTNIRWKLLLFIFIGQEITPRHFPLVQSPPKESIHLCQSQVLKDQGARRKWWMWHTPSFSSGQPQFWVLDSTKVYTFFLGRLYLHIASETAVLFYIQPTTILGPFFLDYFYLGW